MGQGLSHPTGEKLPPVDIPKKFTVKEMVELLEKSQAQKFAHLPNMYPTQPFLEEHYKIIEPYTALISYYKGTGYREVNTFYKTGNLDVLAQKTPAYELAIKEIQKLFKLDEPPTQEEFWPLFAKAMEDLYKKVKPLNHDIITYRGIYSSTIAQNLFDGLCIKSAKYPKKQPHRYCKPRELIDFRYFKDYTATDNVKDYVYETLGFVSTGTKSGAISNFACRDGLGSCDTILAMRLPAGSKFIMPLVKEQSAEGKTFYSDYEYEFILFPLHNTFVIDQAIILNLYADYGDANYAINIYLGAYCNELNKYRPPNFPKQRKLSKKAIPVLLPLAEVLGYQEETQLSSPTLIEQEPSGKCTAEKIAKCKKIKIYGNVGKICKPATGNCVMPTTANKTAAGIMTPSQKQSDKCTAEKIAKCKKINKICKLTTGNCVLPTKANKIAAGIEQKATMPDGTIPAHKITLEPFLIKNGNNFIFDLDMGNKEVNKILYDRIAQDYTNLKSIVEFIYEKDYEADLIVTDYDFDGKYIYITVQKQDGSPFSVNDHSAIIKTVDPYNTGSDTWMEGNIVILRGKELQDTKYADQNVLELGVIVKG